LFCETEIESFAAIAGARRENARAPETRPWHERRREICSRARSGSNSRRTMATDPKSSPLVQLFAALKAERIKFMLVGMSAANLQGVMASTVDVDVWIGLPSHQYMRVINLCRKLNATVRSSNKVFLSDEMPVDFIYEISGLKSFATEFRRAKKLSFHSLTIPVLPLEQICKSKEIAARDKDKLHILLIRQLLKSEEAIKKSRKKNG
jgi:hypothetical protein